MMTKEIEIKKYLVEEENWEERFTIEYNDEQLLKEYESSIEENYNEYKRIEAAIDEIYASEKGEKERGLELIKLEHKKDELDLWLCTAYDCRALIRLPYAIYKKLKGYLFEGPCYSYTKGEYDPQTKTMSIMVSYDGLPRVRNFLKRINFECPEYTTSSPSQGSNE